MNKNLHRRAALFGIFTAFLLAAGCGKEEAEVTVPHVEMAEKPSVNQTEEQKEAELGLETSPGTVIGEEEVVLMTEEGEPESVTFVRVRGNGDYSAAYDRDTFILQASEEELRFEARADEGEGMLPMFLSIRREEGISAEDLADRYVEESYEECTVEEVTVGEGEYPAVWVSYAEGTSSESRTCDIYIIRHEEELYTVWLECRVGELEKTGQEEQTILSTLRFDEG